MRYLPSSLSRSVIREAFGEFPHGVIQFPEPALRRAIRRLKSLDLWHVFEMLFIWLIVDRLLGERRLLIFHREHISMQPDDRRMTRQCLFSIKLPPAKGKVDEIKKED